jgi:signal transduction histidine kinase
MSWPFDCSHMTSAAELSEQLDLLTQELTELREQQAATSKILRLISMSPSQLTPVFDAVLMNAALLCKAKFAVLNLYDSNGFRCVAVHNAPPTPEMVEITIEMQCRTIGHPNPVSVLGRIVGTEQVVYVPDLRAEQAYKEGDPLHVAIVEVAGARTLLAVPMLKDNGLIGAILIYSQEVRPFTDRQIELVRTFADQAAIAIENVRLFNEIQDKSRQLAEAGQQKSRFLAAASHDLRQPMHALGLFVAQLRSHMTSAEGSRLIDHIDDSVTRMNELFNALLDISKLDAGALTPTISEFPVAELLGRTTSAFAPVAQEKGLSFHMVPSDAWVRSDPILLERIILNLVSNAVRYTAAGGIVVGCRRRNGALRIDVCDSGPGIPEEQRRNIFAEFYRLSNAVTTSQAGLGLGLAIVDRLCVLLEHPIQLASTVGKGSRFSITMPMATGQTEPALAPPAVTDVLSGKVVVVIDHDALVLEGMSGLLRSWGCLVITAASPESALASVSRHCLLQPGHCLPSQGPTRPRHSGLRSSDPAQPELRQCLPQPGRCLLWQGPTRPRHSGP